MDKKGGDKLTPYQYQQIQLAYEKLGFESRKEISNIITETPKEINKLYELESSTIESISKALRLLKKAKMGIKGLQQTLENTTVLSKISSLTPEQKQQFSAEYIPQLVTHLTEDQIRAYGGPTPAAKKLSLAFGLGQYTSKNVLERRKKIDIEKAIKERIDLLQVPTGMRKTAETAGITEDQLKNAIALAIPETSTIVESTLTDDIPLPTGDLLRARAAEYYAPFASEQFQQKVAAAREPEPVVEPVKPEVSKQQINQDALAGLPEYAGKMFRAAGAVEKIIDLDDEAFNKQASTAQQTAALLIPDIKEGRSNYETAVQQIEKQFDNPEEIEQALAVLGANMLREFRKQQQITPNLEDIASQPSRNKQ